ncbi:MAG: 23S rRNA (adenine(2503)-C(2))-methyltransferase [Elusimicrobia bacterium CG1_02_63_36]|nr:MAG: 23S rRNA (adenine(2503)-C(2))-methyltransferase [Elusimicrobia bacterium CG1_02_63_36]PIP82205.1 MAG: 23S rRNA (adenine(2503)-C(2))-methyltransferase RlmN [Elusimicrobia bacterium CG22_combo_CG10-13_8_21_14_all_63_91]PJA12787.1 MAG: 23S rRNA (adenine(2503)-C(2))-methyltransferase RlmN [Elusimicrobia bacterium CG_4_10_14_0_2_um_filter_63_34]PJB23003.1 MAG: 23S rRNA (adenine(2503)-C(2))-methyltransferase RlmN [Elusimicrobia bacterium CG_4_9_14_3_um_filter_62_55]
MDAAKLKAALEERNEPKFRLKQVLKAVYQDGIGSYEAMTAIPAALRRELAEAVPLSSVAAATVKVSADGRAHKAALRLYDKKLIESVLLKPKPGAHWTTCISSQVGCAMGCTFCATGLMGLKRNLTAEEIADQVVFWRRYMRENKIKGRLSNVVYMGMGEPLHAIGPVLESLKILLDPERLGLAARHVSVSTVGIVPGMERFLEEFPQVNLALSLHAADDKTRTKLVPVNQAYPLKDLKRVLAYAIKRTGRKIFLEYVLLAGENDRVEHARELAKFVRSVDRKDLLHVNLIVWNPTDTRHEKPTKEAAQRFKDYLQLRGVSVTIRKNLGTDIDGACGQLITETPRIPSARKGKKRR